MQHFAELLRYLYRLFTIAAGATAGHRYRIVTLGYAFALAFHASREDNRSMSTREAHSAALVAPSRAHDGRIMDDEMQALADSDARFFDSLGAGSDCQGCGRGLPDYLAGETLCGTCEMGA